MRGSPPSNHIARFGAFEADLGSGEIRKHGLRIKLQNQPFQILSLLLIRHGGVVTRQQLQQAIWPDGTFVEFDQAINTAMQKIRAALGDSAANPRFVETLPRRGYRFIAPVQFAARKPRPNTRGFPALGWAAALGGLATFVEDSLNLMAHNRKPEAR